jgi:ABC-type glycerol-3-phosphate transport system substrate-binding protein
MLKQWRLKLVAVVAALALTAGCAATMLMGLGGLAALGTYKWVEGTMIKDYPRPMQETYNAAVEAAKKLNLKITSQQYSPTQSHIKALTQDGTDVTVDLIERPNEITTVKIRFGLMGNKDWSAYYHRQIMKILHIPDQP